MKHRRSLVFGLLVSSASIVAFPPSAAIAQDVTADQSSQADAAPRDGELAEIVVTAQKRAEPLQRVPAAVTAFGSDQIARYGFSDAKSLTQQTPGLQIKSSNGQTKPNVFLRGIGTSDFNATASAAVGFYVDEVYQGLQSNQLFQIFDLDRIEVLRGPQGTLYGRNTTGGAINFFTRKPDGSTRANGTLTYGRFDQLEAEAGVQTGLSDTLSIRLSGVYRRSDGDGVNLFDGKRIRDYRTMGGRGIIRWAPDGHEWTLSLFGGRHRGDGVRYHFQRVDNGLFPDDVLPIIGVASPYEEPGGFYDGSWDLPETDRINSHGGSLAGRIDLGGGFTLHSITGYQRVSAYTRFDSDASPLNYVNVIYSDKDWQASQELRLESDPEQRLSWIVGGYFYRDRIRASNHFDIGRFARELFGAQPDLSDSHAPIDLGQFYTQRTRSIAAFGSASYRFSDTLKLTAGLRYTRDRKTLDYVTTADAAEAIGIPALIDVARRRNWEGVTGNAVINYQVTPATLIYASYNRGFKSGVYNASPFFNPDDVNSADPEHVDAYELGLKTTVLDRRLRINLSAFQNSFSDLQVFQFVPDPTTGIPTSRYSNAGAARVRGLEFEIQAKPVPDLTLALSGAYLDAKYTRFIAVADDPATPVNEARDLSGNRLIAAPRWNVSGSIEYAIHVGGVDIVPGYDFSYNSLQYFTAENSRALSQPRYLVHNAGIAIRSPDERYGLMIWARNFTGRHFNNEILPLPDFGLNGVVRGTRASYGITLTARYE
ncbi:TonB-dependent receptor [Sphingomonas colocasiae]|uniref:TonB-dependent receptor n=1 Tax=Sphingomonas colocasiae TaxID=1848973 RepID=A0ABS7PKY1_9SPHN|nr:TonB-dependent receptor [Sphingomonas colocasiae]MBY8821965.1 TonB-dependent receptor [Sphingomonas colocasiae]